MSSQSVVRTRNLAVRVPEDVHDAAMERAKAEGKTLTALVIELLRAPTVRAAHPFPGSISADERARYRMALEAIAVVKLSLMDAGGEQMMKIARQALR